MKSKINVKTILGLISGLLVAVLFQHYILPSLFKPSIDSQIMHFASEMNKNCPFMVDSETRLDNTVPGEGKSILYNYTLINYGKDEIDLAYFDSNLKPAILNTIKTNPEMKYLRENDVTFFYNYNDRYGIRLATLKITPQDYKE